MLKKTHSEWQIHVLAWIGVVLFFSTRDLAFHPVFWQNVVTNTMVCLIAAIPVYINIYLLMPRFLYRKKYVLHFLITVLIIIPPGISIAYLLHEFIGIPFYGILPGKVQMCAEVFLLTGLATTAKAVQQWQIKQRKLQEVEKYSLEQELQLLRNQINPHFMFNTLNNIYVMIKHEPSKARDSILRFSELLSHQLYYSNKPAIPLEQEMLYLKNYIELEKIRQGNAVKLNINIPEKSNLLIAPMLLLPIVENAFKHGFAAGLACYQIDICLEENENEVKFSCINDHVKGKTGRKGGIGLKNVQKRLELLYPKHHVFLKQENDSRFEIMIEISGLNNKNTQKEDNTVNENQTLKA